MKIVQFIKKFSHYKFQKGQTYTVLQEFESPINKMWFYTFVDDPHLSFPTEWFEEVVVQDPIVYPKIDPKTWAELIRWADIIGGKTKPTSKPDEENRLRNLLRPTILPGCCPCGIDRQRCEYHK